MLQEHLNAAHNRILRFFFVLFVTGAQLIISYVSPLGGVDFGAFQKVLSALLICEFTLDLRRRNTTRRLLPNQSALQLPDLNLLSQNNPIRPIQSVLGRLQERVIADMREKSDLAGADADGAGQGESDPETA
ncbi:hypothetical protein Clacol_004586 [Clathrus columnatus]|uniref:Uncharacterized protein n=1 Tax=Clathrus columnatus TaxID=1419009 RepID=A0AAV5AEI2_9AGAM|nr:hypothetical protein Clacol_004586 [Clathrus columnatus]